MPTRLYFKYLQKSMAMMQRLRKELDISQTQHKQWLSELQQAKTAGPAHLDAL